jgi:hypothetical protein
LFGGFGPGFLFLRGPGRQTVKGCREQGDERRNCDYYSRSAGV